MFEDIKKEFSNNVEEYTHEYNSQSELLDELNKALARISDFQQLKCEYRSSEFISLVASIVFIGLALNMMVVGTTATSILCSGIALASSCISGLKSSKCKEILDYEYCEYSGIPNIEITRKEESLTERKELSELELCEIKENLDSLKRALNMIQKYENKSQKIKDDFYTRDDVRVTTTQINSDINNLLNDFLSETVDYANIHFDGSIGDQIVYTERPKQFVKKR